MSCNYRHAKVNDKYTKHYNKDKEPSYYMYWDMNNLYGDVILQKLPAIGFRWIRNLAMFNVSNVKSKMKIVTKVYIRSWY